MKLLDIKTAAIIENQNNTDSVLPTAANIATFLGVLSPNIAPVATAIRRLRSVSTIKDQIEQAVEDDRSLDSVKSAAVIHEYPDLFPGGIGDATTSRVKEHELEQLARDAKRDMMIIRPMISRSEKNKAIRRIQSRIGLGYSRKDLIATALYPGAIKGDIDANRGAICSAVIADAYRNIDFRNGKSVRVVRPVDIHRHPLMKEIAAYSIDEDDVKISRVEQDQHEEETPVLSDLEAFKRYLKPGDLILTKPSATYKSGISPTQAFIGGTGVLGKITKIFNRGDDWGHVSMWTGDKLMDIPKSSNLRNRILGGIRKQAFYQKLYGKSGETTPLHYGVGGALGGASGLGIAKIIGKNPFMGALIGLPLGVLAAEIGGRATRKQRGYR